MNIRSTGRLANGGCYDYDVNKKLEQGSFGKVYRCLQPKNLAIKVIEVMSYKKRDKDCLRYLQNQIKLHSEMSKSKPEHVLSIVDYTAIQEIENSRQCYLVSRLCEGGTLLQYTLKHKPTIHHLLLLIRQAALGIQEMHRIAIIHRDIKPANILLDHDQHVFIIDFGLVTKSECFRGSLVGTPAFMPPELKNKRNREGLDCYKIDIFAFGKTIFQLLKSCEEGSDSPLQQLEKLALKCTSSEPTQRPNISQVISWLDQMLLWQHISTQLHSFKTNPTIYNMRQVKLSLMKLLTHVQ